jgi:3-methyladenine DNA glycosylase AlkC
VLVSPPDERIRELCAKAIVAPDSEVEAIFAELNALLREHAQFVREMTAQTLNHTPKSHSRAKVA